MLKFENISLHIRLTQVLLCALMFISTSSVAQDFEIKNGVNIQASYYNRGRVNIGWELMKTYPEIEAVRIEIEPYRSSQAIAWIREAQENGYQVIATYHDSKKLGSSDKEDLLEAANWWRDHYQSLSSSGPIIINVMNEWGSHDLTVTEYSDAYNEAIEIIRTVYQGELIVDVPGFGQATRIAADAYELFEDKNIFYSVHVYTNAFNIKENRWLSSEDLAYLESSGARCMVGEFCDNSTGGADWCSIIDQCYNQGWPLFGWAWNGDGRNMNMVEPHWRDSPLATTFRPTEFLNRIINKLAGTPCFTLANEGCNNDLIGEACDDQNEYTINDRYNEYCHCTGNFTSELETSSPDMNLIIYPVPVHSNQEISIELFKKNRDGNIVVYNSLGKIMSSTPIGLLENKIMLDVSQYPNGLYWVSFHSDQKVLASKAFIK